MTKFMLLNPPSSVIMEPRFLNWPTVSSSCPLTLILAAICLPVTYLSSAFSPEFNNNNNNNKDLTVTTTSNKKTNNQQSSSKSVLLRSKEHRKFNSKQKPETKYL